MTKASWGLTALVFLLPWAIFMPWLLRWTISAGLYIVGAVVWAVLLIMYARLRPAQPDQAWLSIRKGIRSVLIVHLALIPIFFVLQGIYTVSWFSGKMKMWKEQVQTRVDELKLPDHPEAELMREQIRPLIQIRHAITDPENNDLRWIVESKLHIDVQNFVSTIDRTLDEAKKQASTANDLEQKFRDNPDNISKEELKRLIEKNQR